VNDIDGTHVWVLSVEREGMQRLTAEGRNLSPVWSPDGRWVYFSSDRAGAPDIWRRRADLSLPAERVAEIEGAELPSAVSADGRWLYYSSATPGNSDIGRVSLDGEATVEILVDSVADEIYPRVSPDGGYLVFQSDETGRWDIHVMELDSRRRWIVSSVEGYFPNWSQDGTRIVYESGNAHAYTLQVQTKPEFSFGDPEPTFDIARGGGGNPMDITADGTQLLAALEVIEAGQDTRARVHVVWNWADRVEARLRKDGS